jgi:hypothetical protein
MRLTSHEILLIVVIVTALLVGATVKQYRHSHMPAKPLPEPSSAP